MEEIPKPQELLAARTSAETLFALLRLWFDVPPHVTLDLQEIDSAVTELGDPQLIMAMAMRKLQALHLLTTPGVRTTTDVVLTVIQDLERALLQAPTMHLKQTAAEMDWDAALATLDPQEGDEPAPEKPAASGRSLEDWMEAGEGAPRNGRENGGENGEQHPVGEDDPDYIETFRRHHLRLREAARAVLHASDGRICALI